MLLQVEMTSYENEFEAKNNIKPEQREVMEEFVLLKKAATVYRDYGDDSEEHSDLHELTIRCSNYTIGIGCFVKENYDKRRGETQEEISDYFQGFKVYYGGEWYLSSEKNVFRNFELGVQYTLKWYTMDTMIQYVRQNEALINNLSFPMAYSMYKRNYIPIIANRRIWDEYDVMVKNINRYQKEAVKEVTTKQGIIPIQGPYGTGKSTIIGTIAKLFTDHSRDRILISCQTNTAADNALEKLVELQLRVLRVGRKREDTNRDIRVLPREEMLNNATLECILKKYKYQLEISPQHKNKKRHVIDKMVFEEAIKHLSQRSIHVCTTSTAGRKIMKNQSYDMVIIDEAGQCTEADIMITLRSRVNSLVLVGDHKQLPPFSNIGELEHTTKQLDYNHVSEAFLKILFELSEERGDIEFKRLMIQYRCHSFIAKFLDPLYGPDFHIETGDTVDANRPPYLKNMCLNFTTYINEHRVILVDYYYKRILINTKFKYTNYTESHIIYRLLVDINTKVVASKSIKRKSVFLITPYKGQLKLLTDIAVRFRGLRTQISITVEYQTVDSVQGRECDIVIYSLTRQHGFTGFLTGNTPRALVPCSRARDYLFCVFHGRTYGDDIVWSKLYNKQNWDNTSGRVLHVGIPDPYLDSALAIPYDYMKWLDNQERDRNY